MRMSSVLGMGLGCLVLVGAGCGSSRTAPADPMSPAPAGTGSIIDTARFACAHPYFPVVRGYKVTYASRYAGATNTYSMEVTNTSRDAATFAIAFDNGIRSQQTYACADGGVRATGYVDFGGAMAGTGSAQYETRAVRGVLLPENLRVGSAWSTSFDVVMTINSLPSLPAGAAMGPIEGTVTINRQAIGQEQVTVGAGTFIAMKVRSETSMDMRPTDGGVTGFPVDMAPMVSHEWWVEGNGLVKTETVDGIASEAMEIVTP